MNSLPLKEISIKELFVTSGENCIYEVPVYQRNYAWEKDEISALVHDVYDSFQNDKNSTYFIGTLVSFKKDENVFEIIDGQQRLTTIYLILTALEVEIKNKLTYRARKKSDLTLKNLSKDNSAEKDGGIINGYDFVNEALNEINREEFKRYFLDNVHIIHYQVPKDVDLNHYFEVMNSRGEQLEKHEIVKAKLMQHLSDNDKTKFNLIWESCSQMSVYVQQNFTANNVFDNDKFTLKSFDNLQITNVNNEKPLSISEIISNGNYEDIKETEIKPDQFQPIIDFPNFLLIVLKILRIKRPDFAPKDFNLDDKFLLDEFEQRFKFDENSVKEFAYILLKSRFFLDNYVVHHTERGDEYGNNPWNLRFMSNDKSTPENLLDNAPKQNKLVHLLSMFEVSFTARQRKNYLFYVLDYLVDNGEIDKEKYIVFVEKLADKYFHEVYLDREKLNEINTPKPGSFDEVIIPDNKLNVSELHKKSAESFSAIFGDGTFKTAGIPLFVFNYLDFKIWDFYLHNGKGKSEAERKDFFDKLGCSDFGLDVFNDFYFSRTRRSLEHYYPQAKADGKDGHLDENQINCFGNFAMISSSANSMGSNWDPQTKIDHYLKDSSGKINRIGISSLKFLIMMQLCKDKSKWDFDEIKFHQKKMTEILF